MKNLFLSFALPLAILAKGCSGETPQNQPADQTAAGFVSATTYALPAETNAPSEAGAEYRNRKGKSQYQNKYNNNNYRQKNTNNRQRKISEYQQGEAARTAVFQTYRPLTAAPVKGEKLLTREGYTVSYNPATLQPNYVAWYLTPDRLKGNNKRSESFFEDMDINNRERARLDDYYNSGYDRGHICPAGDNKWSRRAMTESFYLSNMCPQTHTLNHESWRILEEACREWVRYGKSNIYIISGPIFNNRETRKANRRIPVPAQFFKAMLCLDKGHERGIAFIYDNNTADQSMAQAAVSIDDVERITGYDLFNTVNKNLQEKLEKQNRLSDWQRKR